MDNLLRYKEPIEINGQVVVSQEILTHFKCFECGKWPTVSSVTDRLVFCTYCGTENELPPPSVELVGKHEPTQMDLDYAHELVSEIVREGKMIVRPEFPIDWTEYSEVVFDEYGGASLQLKKKDK